VHSTSVFVDLLESILEEALLKDSVCMMWLAQAYETSYRTINRFRTNPLVADLLRQCIVQFRSKPVKEKIDAEVIFIDGTKIKASAMYDELLEKEIIPLSERENEEELSVEELETIVKELDHTIEAYTEKIDESEETSERKQLRSERKKPKKYRKQFADFLIRKSKYQGG